MKRARASVLVVLLVSLAPSCHQDAEKRAGDVSAQVDGADIDEFFDADATADVGEDVYTDASEDAVADVYEEPPGEEVPIEPSDAFLARRAEYLAFCVDSSAPGGNGSVHGQNCRVAAGETDLDDAAIERTIEKLADRRDTSDFGANDLVRLLYLDNVTGALGDARRSQIEESLLAFKYWLDEPGDDGMAYWTENHQILFHTVELLTGQRFMDTAFSNSGMTGAEHVEHARPRIERWLDLRGRYGFSEWHSNVYFNEDIPALVNLVDFAEDPVIRRKAAMVLDIVALDLLHNTYDGLFATTHGRTYESRFVGGLSDGTREAAWIMLGLGEYSSGGNFSGSFLATSDYAPPPLLESLAAAVSTRHEHRQHDSFDIAQGPEAGVSYEGLDDVVVWSGLFATVAPETISGSMVVMEEYDLWNGFLFGSLPVGLVNLLRTLIGTPHLIDLSVRLEPLSRGMALEGVDTFVFRTPHYQLAGAQDFKPAMWGAQTLMWLAVLDSEAFVTTAAPANVGQSIGEVDDVTVDEIWTGGWHPRVTLHRNVGVVQYREQERDSLVVSFVTDPGTLHAYFPTNAFDEVVVLGQWRFGRKGDGYVGLWSQNEALADDDNDYELIVDGPNNVWIVELGSAEEWASFEAFTTALAEAVVSSDDDGVTFDSPSIGSVQVGWTGPMTVDGAEVDLGPYERWQNESTQQQTGSDRLDVTFEGQLLRLDFSNGGSRTLYSL